MPRARHVLLTLLPVLAVCAGAAPSASAHAFVIEGREIAKGGRVAAISISGPSYLLAHEVTTECKKGVSFDVLEAEGKSQSYVRESECHLEEKPGCRVVEPIEYPVKSELVVFNEHLAVKVEPKSGENFTTTTVEKCSESELNGHWELLGTQINELPEAETEARVHESVTTPSGSSLRVREAGSAEEYEAKATGEAKTLLLSGRRWSSR